MKAEDAALIVDMVEAAWGPMRQETAMIYIQFMKDLPARETHEALKDLIGRRSTMPAIAAIRHAVAQHVGLMPPTEAEALGQAERYLAFKEQLAFVNGSGYRPVEPEGIHPAVKAACAPLHLDGGYWTASFRQIYPEQAKLVEAEVLTNSIEGQMLALGSGS